MFLFKIDLPKLDFFNGRNLGWGNTCEIGVIQYMIYGYFDIRLSKYMVKIMFEGKPWATISLSQCFS